MSREPNPKDGVTTSLMVESHPSGQWTNAWCDQPPQKCVRSRRIRGLIQALRMAAALHSRERAAAAAATRQTAVS